MSEVKDSNYDETPGLFPPGEPVYGLPPDEYKPEATFSLTALAEGHDPSQDYLGIPALHAKGFLGQGVIFAGLDTGIDYEHEDLKDQVLKDLGKDYTGSSAGFKDVQSHGTHTAATMVAAKNEKGLVGAAPAAKIIPVKVLNDQGSGASSWIAAGIQWAADKGADIINLSLGGPSPDQRTRQAVQYAISKGCWVFCAAGNDGRATNNYPAHYPESIAVAATDNNGQRASFSTINNENDVSGPGVKVLAATPGNNYSTYSGTSMATPNVAGAAGLLRGAIKAAGKPMPSQQQLIEAIERTSSDISPPGKDQMTGWGRFNTKALLEYFGVGDAPPPPPPDEIVVKLKKGQTVKVVWEG